MTTITEALNIHRPHEREYLAELGSIRHEIEYLLKFIDESPSHRTLAPMVEDLMQKEWRIERALRRPVLPPLPDKLRNPFTRPQTSAEKEYIRKLMRKHGMRRVKSEATEPTE